MIYIGADHGGYKMKEQLKKFLAKKKLEFLDVGAKTLKVGDDYPDYAKLVAKKVSQNPLRNVGILICRSGQGVCIVANKFENVRAALVWNTKEAEMSRTDDMSNVLCLPSDYISEKEAQAIVEVWLKTSYSSEARHVRRVKKISNLEGR
ncbi:MAG TPA: RpiB/LacA/LacB family sugar-phosphate isomerase [Patescibacteria group bacterium]|jgi:RpiB/LacA/LacB family sugar-phosphate isomerase|nr:RpiB/LacA/LacB family sugar-phosphate isomerase [Patescibacteria group bacterium]